MFLDRRCYLVLCVLFVQVNLFDTCPENICRHHASSAVELSTCHFSPNHKLCLRVYWDDKEIRKREPPKPPGVSRLVASPRKAVPRYVGFRGSVAGRVSLISLSRDSDMLHGLLLLLPLNW